MVIIHEIYIMHMSLCGCIGREWLYMTFILEHNGKTFTFQLSCRKLFGFNTKFYIYVDIPDNLNAFFIVDNKKCFRKITGENIESKTRIMTRFGRASFYIKH